MKRMRDGGQLDTFYPKTFNNLCPLAIFGKIKFTTQVFSEKGFLHLATGGNSECCPES